MSMTMVQKHGFRGVITIIGDDLFTAKMGVHAGAPDADPNDCLLVTRACLKQALDGTATRTRRSEMVCLHEDGQITSAGGDDERRD